MCGLRINHAPEEREAFSILQLPALRYGLPFGLPLSSWLFLGVSAQPHFSVVWVFDLKVMHLHWGKKKNGSGVKLIVQKLSMVQVFSLPVAKTLGIDVVIMSCKVKVIQ